MTKIITLAHQKGGVGKSTIVLNLTLCFKDHLSVALNDSDLQGSIYHIREDFPELDILAPEEISGMQYLKYDLIIVDTPPYLSNRLNELFGHSDFILVPTEAGFFDVMAIRSTLAMIKFSQTKNQRLKAGIVLNMIKPRSGIMSEVATVIEALGTPLLRTRVYDRASLARSSITAGVLKGADQKVLGGHILMSNELMDELNCCLFAVSKMYVCVTNGILPSLPKSVRGHDQTLQSRFD